MKHNLQLLLSESQLSVYAAQQWARTRKVGAPKHVRVLQLLVADASVLLELLCVALQLLQFPA